MESCSLLRSGPCQAITRNWRWVITISAFFLLFTSFGFLYSFGIISVAIQEEFNVGVTAAGWVPAIATCLSLMGGVGAEWLIKKTSYRFVGIAGVTLSTAACIMTSYLPVFMPMYLTFGVINGVGLAMSMFSSMILIRDWFPDKHLAIASTMSLSGTSSGMLVLNPVTYVLVSGVGWRNTLRITGAIIFISGLASCATFSPPSKQQREESSDSKSEMNIDNQNPESGNDCVNDNTGVQSEVKEQSTLIHFELLSFPEFWMLFLGIVLCEMSCTFFLYYWVELLLTLGFQESTAALAMTVMGGSDITGKLLTGWVADYLPFPKLFLFNFACISGICVMLALLGTRSTVAIFVISSVSGVFVLSLLNCLPFLISNQVFPGRGATPMTSATFSFGLGIILGTVYGTSKDNTGSFTGTLLGCIAAYAVAFTLFALVPLYQKFRAPDRYLMWNNVPTYRKRNKSSELHTQNIAYSGKNDEISMPFMSSKSETGS